MASRRLWPGDVVRRVPDGKASRVTSEVVRVTRSGREAYLRTVSAEGTVIEDVVSVSLLELVDVGDDGEGGAGGEEGGAACS